MLDSDVAMLYHYETKYINLAVRRNKERFPENFCFQLTENETERGCPEIGAQETKNPTLIELDFLFLGLLFQDTLFKQRKLWWKKVFTICLYRTRNIYVSRSSKE